MVRWILVAAAAACLTAPELAGAVELRSGPLRAATTAAPWSLRFEDRAGRLVLAENPGEGSGPTGTLGFQTAAGWFHATNVSASRRSGRALEVTLDTTDPLGRTLEARIAPAASGSIRVSAVVRGPATGDVSATGIAFGARPGERYLGFGERSDAVDQRGRTIENYVADGPYQPDEYPLLAAFVPSAGLHARDDSTYFPMPWLLSSAGYGVLVDNTQTSRFRLRSDQASAWSVEVDSTRLAFRVFAGPRPADVLRRLTAFTGRQPKPVAPWIFGAWYQPTAGDFPQAQKLRRADVPASAANTYTHYLPCGAQRGSETAERARTRGFHRAGYAVTTYFNPMICSGYQPVYGDAAAAGLLTKNALGQPYTYNYTGSTVFNVGQVDFSAPGADAFYGALLDQAAALVYDGWMEYFGEYTPTDSRSANGMRGTQMHNLYPLLYHRSSWRYQRSQGRRPLASFVRSGWTGVQRYAQLVWGGDPTTAWGFDGLRSAVYQALSIGTSGISRWGSDIGGFFSLGQNSLTPELLKRWIELGAVSGVMRTEAGGFAVPAKPRPQVTDPSILPVWRRYAKLRTQLYPYLRAADRVYRRTGMPLMRQLALVFPNDRAAVAQSDEFMFGPNLLAAPVLEPGARTRRLYLPRGRWVDIWQAVSYRERTGALRLNRARLATGHRELTIPAPLRQLPLLARAGAIVPLLAPGVDTLAPYGHADGLVHLADRSGRLDLLAFPRGRSSATIGSGAAVRSTEGAHEWHLAIRGRSGVGYRLQASLATLRHPFVPKQLRLDGHTLPAGRWSYRPATEVLRANLPPAAGSGAVSLTVH